MTYNGGKYFGPSYFGARYWGTGSEDLPAGSVVGFSIGTATVTGVLTNGAAPEQVVYAYNGGRSAGGAVRKFHAARKKKRQEELDQAARDIARARARGTLRRMDDVTSAPSNKIRWGDEAERLPVLKSKTKHQGEHTEQITEASRRVIDALLAQAAAQAQARALAAQQAEEDDEDILELLLLDAL